MSIRKFAKDPIRVQNLIEFGTIIPEIAQVPEAIVKARLNILISGGTGTGKTTFLNVLSSFIPLDERIITIEDSAELHLQQEDLVRLETRPPNLEGSGEITQRDLVRNALRMRPDRFIVGECRGADGPGHAAGDEYRPPRLDDDHPRQQRHRLRLAAGDAPGPAGNGVDRDGVGETTTLGRGGSDTTAVALAARLGADRCQIFTDVRGIYTADPRIVPGARQLPVVGYEEMLELAHQGAQVMQVRAVELGWVNDVVIEVLSSFEEAPGTLIKEDPLMDQRNKVRGLAHDRNVAKVTLVEVPDRPGVAASVFTPLSEAGINVDMIVQNVGHHGATDLSFTIPAVDLAKAKRVLDPIVRDLGFREMTTDSAVAKVSIVGAGIHNAPGYAARIFRTLAEAGVDIEMNSTSEIRITCMIAVDQVETAVRALHEAFELERPEPVADETAAGAGR